MKVKDAILTEEVQVQLTKNLSIMPEVLQKFWTYNNVNRRVQNFQLIEKTVEAWQKSLGGSYEVYIQSIEVDTHHVYQIDAQHQQINKVNRADILQMDIEQLGVGRMIVTLAVKGMDETLQPTLTILLTEKGEKFAIGETVNVCTNLTIFGADSLIDTLQPMGKAKQKWTTETSVEYFKTHFFSNTEQVLEADLKKIEALKQETISTQAFQAFLGHQLQRIEYANHARLNKRISELSKEEKYLPITSYQLSKVALEAYAPTHEIYAWENGASNRWSVINYGTEFLKGSQDADLNTLLDKNHNWVQLAMHYPFSKN